MQLSTKRPSSGAIAKPIDRSGGSGGGFTTRSVSPKKDGKATPAGLSKDAYLNDPAILAIIQDIKNEFGEKMDGQGGKRPLLVSDVIDDQGHQYVNLVQKGGGVLGIALVGYTHILEQAGIRFIRMAGTSAGAINTSLFTAVGPDDNPKAVAKSGDLIQYLSELDMFSFVDGHPFAKWLIRNFISDTNFQGRIKKLLLGLVSILGLLFLASIILLGLEWHWKWEYASLLTRTSFVLTGLSFLLVASVGNYLNRMLTRLKDSGYGINPGNAFLEWIKSRLDENGVSTIDDLNAKASHLPADLKMRDGSPLTNKEMISDVTFISSELVTQNKIEFPKMWCLFRSKADINQLHPGEFVRASMSIPFFFESHIISNIPSKDPDVQAAWKDTFGCLPNQIPGTVRFVDGGVLSNFPINIFYNSRIAEARLPSFGIDLDDSDPNAATGMGAASWSLGDYMGRMLNTIRFYYDKDFLLKNNVFARGVGKVNLQDKKFNWLDFFLADQTKLELFIQGAKAARDFLIGTEAQPGFDWEAYKVARREMYKAVELDKT